MRLILIVLTALLVMIQYPLWLGKGGWLRVWDLSRQLDTALEKEQELRQRNEKLAGEVQDRTRAHERMLRRPIPITPVQGGGGASH